MNNRGSGFEKVLMKSLADRNLLAEVEFRRLQDDAEKNRLSLIEALYRCEKLRENELLAVVSLAFGYDSVAVENLEVDPRILSLIPGDWVKAHRVVPVNQEGDTLCVAVIDPTEIEILDDVRTITGLRVRPVLTTPSQLEEALAKYYGEGDQTLALSGSESFVRLMEEVRSQIFTHGSKRGVGDLSDLLEVANASPIVRLVNQLLIEAIRRKSSDVFVEPLEKTMRVRYRIDGVLEEILSAPRSFIDLVVSRIKVMSRLNIAEHRLPQDGRFKVRIFGPEVDLRVSILPTCYGEKACLRILDTSGEAQGLESLGFEPNELEMIRRSASRPHGMILVTGPTGSGKTTSLYAVLKYLNSVERNITTVEDPVEYQIPGINQVNVREGVGLTFPTALRSILRQDPDIILVGEIRDLVTMDIAMKAALTGHLVLSTLHTNDATSAIVRMFNMGVEPFLIASSVLMISAQRLVRKLCSLCRTPYTPERETLTGLGLPVEGKFTFYQPKGCERCRSTGFKGRTVLTELFELTPKILDLLMHRASGDELRQVARKEGMRTLRESGIEKVKSGITSVEEVMRVTVGETELEPV